MELQYDDKNLDLVLAFKYMNDTTVCTKIKNGLVLMYKDERYNDLAAIIECLQNTEYKEYANKSTIKEVNEIKNKSLKHIFKNVDMNEKIEKLTFSKVYLYTRIYRGIKECNSYTELEMKYFEMLQTKIEEKIKIKRIDYFEFLDIRVGKIIDVKEHPDADSLFIETVLIEEDGKVLNILSGLRKYVKADDLLNKKFLFLVNMKKAKLRGIESEGMILCIKNESGLEIIKVADSVKEGTQVMMVESKQSGFDVVEDAKQCLLDAKSDFYKKVMSKLQANNGLMSYDNNGLSLNGQIITTETQNGQIS